MAAVAVAAVAAAGVRRVNWLAATVEHSAWPMVIRIAVRSIKIVLLAAARSRP